MLCPTEPEVLVALGVGNLGAGGRALARFGLINPWLIIGTKGAHSAGQALTALGRLIALR